MRMRIATMLGLVLLASLVLIPTKALAQSTAEQNIVTVLQQTEDVGITPDSPFYGLKVGLIERIKLALTRNEMKRTELMLRFAERRLEEAKLMAAKGDPAALEKAIRNYDAIMDRLERELERAKMKNDTQKAEMIEEVLMQLEAQKEELGDAEDIAEIALQDNKTRQEVLQMLEQLRQRLREREKKVEMRREMIRKILKQRYNLSDEEINRTLERIENETVERNMKFRAQHEIVKANRTITLVENLIAKMEARNVSAERIEYAKELLNTAKDLLSQAQENFNEGNYLVAWELAKKSEIMAHLAVAGPDRRRVYRILEMKMEREGLSCRPEEAEKRVEAQVSGGEECRVMTIIGGNYLVRCRTRHGIENYVVAGKNCEIKKVSDFREVFRIGARKQPVERRELREREEIARKIRERLEEIKKEKGNITPEDVRRVVREVREELMRERMGPRNEIWENIKNETRTEIKEGTEPELKNETGGEVGVEVGNNTTENMTTENITVENTTTALLPQNSDNKSDEPA